MGCQAAKAPNPEANQQQAQSGRADNKYGDDVVRARAKVRPKQPNTIVVGGKERPSYFKLPLTPLEIARVQESWEAIRSKMKETGIQIFIKYELA